MKVTISSATLSTIRHGPAISPSTSGATRRCGDLSGRSARADLVCASRTDKQERGQSAELAFRDKAAPFAGGTRILGGTSKRRATSTASSPRELRASLKEKRVADKHGFIDKLVLDLTQVFVILIQCLHPTIGCYKARCLRSGSQKNQAIAMAWPESFPCVRRGVPA